jgi:hypothetical protein
MASPGTESGAGRGAGLVLVTLGSGQFLMTPDSSVMNVAIATVAKDVPARHRAEPGGPAGGEHSGQPPAVSTQASTELTSGIPFLSDAGLQKALTKAGARCYSARVYSSGRTSFPQAPISCGPAGAPGAGGSYSTNA